MPSAAGIDHSRTRPEIDLLVKLSRLSVSTSDVERCRRLIDEQGDSMNWGFFIDQAGRHKVLPLVSRNISRYRLDRGADGDSAIPYRWLYATVYAGNRKRNDEQASEFGNIFRDLNAARIPYAVRKGPVLAELLYHDPGLRSMLDLDVLVARDDVKRMGRLLEARGFTQGRIQRDQDFVTSFDRSTRAFWKLFVNNELPYVKPAGPNDVDDYCVDICLDIFQKNVQIRIPVSELLSRRTAVHICGTTAFALAPEDQFIDLCLHLYKEATGRFYIERGMDLQLSKFLDIALSCLQLSQTGSWDAVLHRAETCGASKVLYYVLHHTALVYPEAVPGDLLTALLPEDASFLDEYGAVDGKVGTWQTTFADRLFLKDRKSRITGASSVPMV